MHDQYNPDRITDPLVKERLLSCKYYNADELVRGLESEAGHDHDKISTIFLNCRSLSKNFDELLIELDLDRTGIDFICLAETWLNQCVEQLYSINRYESFYNSRTSSGRGVAIYVKSGYRATRINPISVLLPYLESIFVKVEINSKTFILGDKKIKKITVIVFKVGNIRILLLSFFFL